jgi:hypothetical protein
MAIVTKLAEEQAPGAPLIYVYIRLLHYYHLTVSLAGDSRGGQGSKEAVESDNPRVCPLVGIFDIVILAG